MYGKDRDGIGRAVLVSTDGMPITQTSLEDAALEGRLFSAANQAVVTTTAAMATTWTGLGVANPTGSGKLYRFWEFGWAQATVMNTEGPIGVFAATYGAGMAQTIAPQCARLAYKTTTAFADSAATISSPLLLRVGGSSMEGTIGTAPSMSPNVLDLKGAIIIPPGSGLYSYTYAIQTASIMFYMVWEEIDTP